MTVPYFPIRPNPNPDFTQVIQINDRVNASGNLVWEMNGSSFRANYNNPLLLLAHQRNTSYPYNPEWNTYNFGKNKTVRVVVNNNSPIVHVCLLLPWLSPTRPAGDLPLILRQTADASSRPQYVHSPRG